MSSFQEKVIFITGASAGIGEALAKEWLEQGAKIALFARRLDRLQALQEALDPHQERILCLKGDVTKPETLQQAVQEIVRIWGKIDIVVANAGFGVMGDFSALTVEDYRFQFETNLFGVLHTIHATLEELKETQGTLVLMGSVSSYISKPGTSAYAMSKFALRALADALFFEFKKWKIGVVLISPGLIQTEFHRVNNQGVFEAEFENHYLRQIPSWLFLPARKAARQIIRAVSKRRKEQIITFHGKLGVWVKRHFPRILDWFLGWI